MSDTGLVNELAAIPGLEVKTAEPLARYTSMKIGGPADYFIEAADDAALCRLLPLLQDHGAYRCACSVMAATSWSATAACAARCSVWRVHSKDASGAKIMRRLRPQAGAACVVTRLAREAARKNYAGLEFAEGIPGTIGGALVMNAGAYGSEFEKIVERVEGVTPQGAAFCFFPSADEFFLS